MERKRTLDNAFEEIGQVKRDAEKLQKQKTMEEEGHKKSSSKVDEKKPSEPLNDSLQALKQELLSKIKSNISTSHQSSDLQKGSGEKGKEDKNKIVEEKPEDKGQENDSDDSDEDDEKLLELKKKSKFYLNIKY